MPDVRWEWVAMSKIGGQMDLETIRAKHIPVPATLTKRKPQPLMCTSCCDPWPCDTEKVLEELDRLVTELRAAEGRIQTLDALLSECHFREANLKRRTANMLSGAILALHDSGWTAIAGELEQYRVALEVPS